MKLIFKLITGGLRLFQRRIKIFLNKNKFLKVYKGNHIEICKAVVKDCWNKEEKFFKTSNGHFNEFYTRDFAYNIESLIKLGYKKQCVQTIDYALAKFKEHKHITTSITPKGKPINFPKYTPESLALIIYCLNKLNNKKLVDKYKQFLERETLYVFNRSINKKTGLVTKKEDYFSCRDHVKRYSACYDNTMIGLLNKCLSKLKLKNPFKKYNYEKLLIKYFWKKDHFIDDLSGIKDITGDANSAPYRFLLTDKKYNKMLIKSIRIIRKLKLDYPFPIKYSTNKIAKRNIADFFAKDYETDSIWPHVAYNYLFAVKRVNKNLLKKYLIAYKKQIEKHKTFPEVYDKNGKIFRSFFYFCDEAMLWCANHIVLCEKLKINSQENTQQSLV